VANNRLYLVNKETRESFELAKDYGNGWIGEIGEFDDLEEFLSKDRAYNDSTDIIIGIENDDQFFETWIKPSIKEN
jgi:hypothetical protein